MPVIGQSNITFVRSSLGSVHKEDELKFKLSTNGTNEPNSNKVWNWFRHCYKFRDAKTADFTGIAQLNQKYQRNYSDHGSEIEFACYTVVDLLCIEFLFHMKTFNNFSVF